MRFPHCVLSWSKEYSSWWRIDQVVSLAGWCGVWTMYLGWF
jgi:hypothetical protein